MKNLSRSFSHTWLAALLMFSAAAISSNGCSTVMDQKVAEIEPGAPQYVVRMDGQGWSKPETKKGPITQGMTIDDVLVATRAKQKFRNMEIKIYRRVPSTGQVVKMPISFKASDRAVKPEQNYAIHPNDQILIRQVSVSALDRMVDVVIPANAK